MKISFKYSYHDYEALCRARNRHTKFPKLAKITCLLVVLFNIGISIFFVYIAISEGREVKLVNFANGALGLAFIILYYVIKLFYLRRYYKQQMIDGKEIKLSFSDDGISIDMPSFQGKYEWLAIIRADQQPSHFFLWINKMQAFCVPKRAFATENETEEFKSLVVSKVENQELIK